MHLEWGGGCQTGTRRASRIYIDGREEKVFLGE